MKLQENLKNQISGNDHNFLKTEFPDNWNFLKKNVAYPSECFNKIDDDRKSVKKFKEKTLQ